MKMTKLLSLMLAMLLILSACTASAQSGDLMAGVASDKPQPELNAIQQLMGMAAVYDFNSDLLNYATQENPGENVLASPLSALEALTMTACGAQGDTLTQL